MCMAEWPERAAATYGICCVNYENYVIMELVKNYAYAKNAALISFYLDDTGGVV